MSNYWILIILAAISLGLSIKWFTDKSKDFGDIIQTELEKHGLKYVKSRYPGLFKVGPFKKFEITVGKPLINNGAIQYDHTYYRIVELKTKTNRTELIWAKIDTNWFKETNIDFRPRLSELKK